ncbi:hypothetical protein BJ165DRAFT_1389824 [Panaeolus papilionaceus]|nr:hypothetical protein BJ165DRAFT_1389824 [Panaeolus papilionaceus]
MKLLSLLACATSVASVAARPLHCGNPADAVPFYRIPIPTDHFYTANPVENAAVQATVPGPVERPPGRVFTSQAPGTVPLYRLYSEPMTDHHYTTSLAERDSLIANTSYNYEGIAGYVYPDANCGGIPLYRSYISAPIYDHFFTSSAAEVDAATAGGFSKEGIAAWIVPL